MHREGLLAFVVFGCLFFSKLLEVSIPDLEDRFRQKAPFVYVVVWLMAARIIACRRKQSSLQLTT